MRSRQNHNNIFRTTPVPTQPPKTLATSSNGARDPLFRRLVSLSTSMALGGMLGSLGAIERSLAGKLEFRWHWAMLPLALAGFALGHVFWKILWRAESEGTDAARRRLKSFSIALGVIALCSFAYPIRFVQDERRNEVFIGLGLAVLVLSGFGWLIWKTIEWVSANEPADGEVDPPPLDPIPRAKKSDDRR